ncbi:MAG: 50S ribosomal protein L32e, partial [Thermoplasmatales archaeon]
MKPDLDKDTQRLLDVRNRMNRKRPEFHRQEWFRYKKLGDSWRKPRGKHSKLREKKGYRQAFVESGYRGPNRVRGLHPSGFLEKYVTNVKELEGIDGRKQAVRISSSVGRRKRLEIQEKAKQMGIR